MNHVITMRLRLIAFYLGCFTFANLGCSRSTGPAQTTTPSTIKGKVHFQHEPLIKGKIQVEDANNDMFTVESPIAGDGTFSLALPFGDYKVMVSGETESYESLPPDLMNPNSGLTFRVESGKTDYPVDIVLPEVEDDNSGTSE